MNTMNKYWYEETCNKCSGVMQTDCPEKDNSPCMHYGQGVYIRGEQPKWLMIQNQMMDLTKEERLKVMRRFNRCCGSNGMCNCYIN